MIRRLPAIATSTAVFVLLASCGSASDSGSPTPTAGTQGATGAGLALKAPATRAAVSDDSISAELLASILVSAEGQGILETTPSLESRYVSTPAVAWTGAVPGGQMQLPARYGAVGGTQHFSPDQNLIRLQTNKRTSTSFAADRFNGLGIELSLAIDRNDLDAQNPTRLRTDAAQTAGKLLASLGAGIRVTSTVSETDTSVTMRGEASGYPLRAGARIPFYQTLYRWSGTDGQFAELLLLRSWANHGGNQDVRLCLNVHAPDIKRLSCSIWQVPANWTLGSRIGFQGFYIVDDRSTYPNESGQRFWQSPVMKHWQTPEAGLMIPRAATSPMGLRASSAIGWGGISGDVLATMIAQDTSQPLPGASAARGGFRSTVRAYPWTAPVPDGARWSGGSAFEISGSQWTASPRYVQLPYFTYQLNTLKATSYETSAEGRALPFAELRLDLPMLAPEYMNFTAPGQSKIQFSASSGTGTELLNLSLPARLGMPVQVQPNLISTEYVQLNAVRPYSVRKGALVPFNQGLQSWRASNGNFAEMLLLRGAQADQARLCFNIHALEIRAGAPVVKRLICHNWQVPAGWTLGQPLVSRGISVIDDRSVNTDESGLRYWQSEALN